jgi:hypothetical protein
MGIISALPSKRIYRSIMQDYNLLTAVCELIDNVIDNWKNNWKKSVLIDIEFDIRTSTIIIFDNSWWIENLEHIIAPWKTWNTWNDEIIGIFWVWSKRAAIALAKHVRFRTFFKKPLYIEYDENWLEDENNWDLEENKDTSWLKKWTTKIELSKLRVEIWEEIINSLKEELSFIYGLFLKDKNLILNINWKKLEWKILNNWWEYNWNKPIKTEYCFKVDWKEIKLNILSWIKTQTSSSWEYGVYFYWNNRLIAKEIKDKEVWYYSWNAWLPHPYASLGQFIIEFHWPSNLLPWNSSKTWIVYSHEIYKKIRNIIEKFVWEYTKLSRKIVSSKDILNVKKYNKKININKIKSLKILEIKTYLPSIPKKTKFFSLKEKNSILLKKKKYLEWILETFVVINFIYKKNLNQKNRIILILLDSSLEISLKEYLLNDVSSFSWNIKSMNLKEKIDEVWKTKPLILKYKSNFLLNRNIRNTFIHDKAYMTVTSKDLEEYERNIQTVLKEIFWIKF